MPHKKAKTISYYEMSYEDIPQVAYLERQAFSQPWSESGITTYLDSGTTIFVVAKHRETVVGYGAVMRVLDESDLISLVVDENYRRLGIAREILDISYDIARENGVKKIHLEVRKGNEAARRLYESEGFKETGKRPGFYERPKEDAILYTKEL